MKARAQPIAAPSPRPAPRPRRTPQAAPARLACACGGRCPRCSPAGAEAEADRVARAALQRPGADGAGRVQGARLSGPQRAFFEPVVGTSLDGVRLHRGPAADAAARREGASAYAIGDDVVLGARAQGAGVLAHVAQQRHGAPRRVQRLEGAFAPEYESRPGRGVKTYSQLGYEQYMQILGPLPAASQGSPAATRIQPEPLTLPELLEIFPQLQRDLDAGLVDGARVEQYRSRLSEAFRVLRIDTVEAQAAYLANATHEAGQLRWMTETQNATGLQQAHQADPSRVALDEAWLNRAEAESAARKQGLPLPPGAPLQVQGYEKGGSILPASGRWERSFIGRGPVQVTHRHGYVQALAVLERRLQELQERGEDEPGQRMLREAIVAIKADPREAANPAHAFVFSAALMKMPDAKGVRGDQKASRGQVTSWMGPQPAGVAARKREHFAHVKAVLLRKYAAQLQPAETAPP